MPELHVFCGECDWVVASDRDDAWVVWCESNGEDRADYEPKSHPNGHLLGCDVGCERKTCAEWAKQGRGFLCSTEY